MPFPVADEKRVLRGDIERRNRRTRTLPAHLARLFGRLVLQDRITGKALRLDVADRVTSWSVRSVMPEGVYAIFLRYERRQAALRVFVECGDARWLFHRLAGD